MPKFDVWVMKPICYHTTIQVVADTLRDAEITGRKIAQRTHFSDYDQHEPDHENVEIVDVKLLEDE